MKNKTVSAALLAFSLVSGCAFEAKTPPPTGVFASTQLTDRVTVLWTISEQAQPSGFMVHRDGQPLAILPSSARSYEDLTAAPGLSEALGPLDATSRTDGVKLSWQAPLSHPGPEYTYNVVALYSDQAFPAASPVKGARAAQPVAFELRRDGGPWIELGSATSHLDTQAPMGSIRATSEAIPDALLGYVTLSFAEEPSIVAPTPSTYALRIAGQAEEVVETAAARTVERGLPSIQWQRSPVGDATFEYQNLRGVVTSPSYDLEVADAPSSYRALMKVPGAEGFSTAVEADAPRYVNLSLGENSACAVRASDKRRVCWGDNDSHQAPPGLSTEAFSTISLGVDFGCGLLMASGKRVCWGRNTSNQAPPDPSEEAFASISAGRSHACGLLEADHSVRCWGTNLDGESTPHDSIGPYVSIDGGSRYTCGLLADGRVTCWGYNANGRAPPGPSAAAYVSVGAGQVHTCALRQDNAKVGCWGMADYTTVPDALADVRFVGLDVGSMNTCAIRESDLQVECWGSGGLKWGSRDRFDMIGVGSNFACGLRADNGTVQCWGDNSHGQAPSLPLLPVR